MVASSIHGNKTRGLERGVANKIATTRIGGTREHNAKKIEREQCLQRYIMVPGLLIIY
jgi:hypothetical protein